MRMDKIGTGEGAQAYGHGLYNAEAESVGKRYQESLAGKSLPIREIVEKHFSSAQLSETDLQAIYRAALNNEKNPQASAKSVQMAVPGLRDRDASFIGPLGENGQKIADAIAEIRDKGRGRMYEVNIRANPDDFLDWDKKVRDMPVELQKLLLDKGLYRHEGDIGSQLWHRAVDEYGQFAASEKLRNEGIPGIKYLDQGSRGAGEGSRNYVVFDDKLIDILRKYGMAGLMALPAGYQLGGIAETQQQ
jgi:hypothetical protein